MKFPMLAVWWLSFVVNTSLYVVPGSIPDPPGVFLEEGQAIARTIATNPFNG